MFCYSGHSVFDLQSLYDALKDAARSDNTRGDVVQHRDGWGCIIHTDGNTVYYRSKDPIFEDTFDIPPLEGEFQAIFHAREASNHDLIGSQTFSHPFMSESVENTVYLAHNGQVDGNLSTVAIDSELILKKIMESQCNLGSIQDELKKMTVTALNLFVLIVKRDNTARAELSYMNYWLNEKDDRNFEMFSADLTGGRAVFSSTLTRDIRGVRVEKNRFVRL